MGDPHRVRQAVLNLVSSAIRSTNQGKISVHIRLIGTLMWSVSVTYIGHGIAKRRKPLVSFERFQQADQAPAREQGDIGLSLAIARDLAHMMGGELRTSSESVRESGHVFTLTLPLYLPDRHEVALKDDDTIKVDTKGTVVLPQDSGKRTELAEDKDNTHPTDDS
jgi:signal transduction histidine kinase